MKYIIIRGNHFSGRLTTNKELCFKIDSISVFKLNVSDTTPESVTPTILAEVDTDNVLIFAGKKTLLVVPAALTGQRVRISRVIASPDKLEICIDVAIIAMATREKIQGFGTKEELQQHGKCIYGYWVKRIPSHQFCRISEWNQRIRYQHATLNHYT